MTYDEAIEYIHSVCWMGSRPGLSRITELCARLGNPEKSLKCIHIGGTNGKGSTSAFLTSILRTAGYKVGSFTSPYVRTFNERIAINGEPVDNGILAEVVEYVRPYADAMEDRPTEFELISAIGFEIFKRENVDIVVLEVGMGGRFDSTNVIESPLVSVITGIAFDHMGILGDTLAKIAWEKAGILKKNCPAVLAELQSEAREVFDREAKEKGSELFTVSPSEIVLKEISLRGITMDYKERKNIKTSLIGEYQQRNIALVCEVVDMLRTVGYDVSEDALYRGIAAAKWPARFELLMDDPVVVFDGGHNEEGVASAIETAKKVFGGEKPVVLTGVMADKAYEKMVSMIAGVASEVFTLKPDNPRALDAEQLAAVYRKYGVKATSGDSIADALSKARDDAKQQKKPLLILGSLYLYKDVYKEFE
ncbi:MAG: bifunctional folylpolyglutamate synthase/dihydrofolate synthase [Clostridia bacterium]|nr:bifunctional folylpolyglutamate synthase/dihydrofolate synthase [Clostridia bacterium]